MQTALTKTRSKTHEFIKALATEGGIPGELKKAEFILLAVFHGWRNNLSLDAAIEVLTHLPPFFKEIFVLNWKPSWNGNCTKDMNQILKSISHEYGLHSFPPLSREEASAYYIMVKQLLKKHVPEADFLKIQPFLMDITKTYPFENAA